MSEKVITATSTPGGETNAHAQKLLDASKQDQLEAFNREFGDADVDTDAIIADEAKKQEETAQLNKLAELDTFLDNADDRRRGLKAIYGSEVVNDMSDEWIEEFIAERLGKNTAAPAEAPQIIEQKDGPEILDTNDSLPTGFPTPEEVQADMESEGPVKLGFWKRARLLAGAPGRAVWRAYGAMFDRSAKHSAKMRELSANDPVAYEKYKKRTGIISTLAAVAIGGAYLATKSEHFLSLLDQGNGSGTGHDVTPNAADHAADLEHQAHIDSFIYDPAKDPFNQPGRHEFNFTSGIDMSDPAKAKAQLLENWKHNPTQFAAVLASAGVIENTPDALDKLADQMKADPSVYADHYDKFVASLGDNVQFREGQEGYGSFSAVDNGNGGQTIAYQSQVWGDKQPFIVLASNDKPLYIGGHCGQPVFLPETSAPSVVTVPQGGAPAPTFTQATYQPPIGNGNYTPPETPRSPETPTAPEVPETPTTPEVPETPETPTPKSSNINDYQRPGTDNTTDSGIGDKPQVTAPADPEPAPVVEQQAPSGESVTDTPSAPVNTPAPDTTSNTTVGNNNLGGNNIGTADTTPKTNTGDLGGPAE